MKLLKLLKSLKRYFEKDTKNLILFIILTFLLCFRGLLFPYLWGIAIEELTLKHFNNFILYLAMWGGLSLFLDISMQLPNNLLNNKLELNFMQKVSKDLYSKILKLPAVAYEDHGVGEFVNRVYTDPDRIIELLGRLIRLTARLITGIIVIIISFSINWILAIEMLVFAILTYILTDYYRPKIKKTYKEIKEESDKYIKEANQSLTGIREIKGLGIRKIIEKYTNNNIDTVFEKQLKIRNTETIYYTIIEFIYVIMEFLILATCGYLFVKGQIVFAVFIMFEMYIYRIYDVVSEFSQFSISYQKIITSLTRISEILDNKLYNDESFGKLQIDKIIGTIEFKNVVFAYPNEKSTLKKLNLKIETGKKIAIVGKSGMGKSTIFNLLLRFFPIKSGEILIDNIKIEDFSEESLRKHIAVIRQEPYLFNKTIKENFEMINPKIKISDIKELCEKAYIHDYIMSLPKKYNTVIGEGGVNLSGGQKQRIAIARALAKDSKIILFDEATSALDNESQDYVKKTIDELAKNHTIITIAHRLSTIMDADEIILIDGGIVKAKGTHNELIQTSDIYKKLYNSESINVE
ncbi:MAG: ABC transporter ATP-binding protein [Ignavibacteriales bacterium]